MPDIQKIKIHIKKVHQGTGNEYILPSVKNPNLKGLQKHFHQTKELKNLRKTLKNICLDHPYSHPGMKNSVKLQKTLPIFTISDGSDIQNWIFG